MYPWTEGQSRKKALQKSKTITSRGENTAVRLEGQAWVYPRIGREAEGAAAMKRLETEFGEEWDTAIAEIYADNGNPDKAFEWLEKVYEVHGPSKIAGLPFDRHFDSLRQDPRWQPLLDKAAPTQEQLEAIEFEVTLPE